MNPSDLFRSAVDHHHAGRFDEAMRLYRDVLKVLPGQPAVNHNIGILAVQLDQAEAALPYFRNAVAAVPDQLQYRLSYARALLSLGRVCETVEVVNGVVDSGPAELKALYARAKSLLHLADQDGIAKIGKVFCIGRNKTGTTSVEAVLAMLGFRMGNQAKAEMLIEDWAQRDFNRIIEFCRSADAFQDIPFSLPNTFQALDRAFPGSKFILTVRTTPEDWFNSVTRFHTKIVGKGRLPTAADLQAFPYRVPGWLWRNQELVYGIDADTLYSEHIYKAHYIEHNRQVIGYFKHRPSDLLVLNLADENSAERLCSFLGFSGEGMKMPHLNRSD
jgi:tetratricopeptide (TPR) repeat protein